MNFLALDELKFQTMLTNKDLNLNFHIHNTYEIYLLLEGEVNLYVHETCYHIKPGTLMIFNDLEMHKSIPQDPNKYKRIYIHIPPAFLSYYGTEETDLAVCFVKRNIGTQNLIRLEIEQINFMLQQVNEMQEARDLKFYGYDLIIYSCLLKILVMVNTLFKAEVFDQNIDTQYPSNIREIIKYVDEHIAENLSLDEIAEALSLNKYYLCHIFKQETGTTIFRYILLKRISLSRILLAEGKNVTEACFGAGFQNYTNFITEFRKVTGFTPKKFRDLKLKPPHKK